MSYNALLDGYFSSYWLSMGIPVLIIILFYVFRNRLLKGRDATFGEVCIVMGFAFVMIMTAGMANPMWWGFGTPEAVREIRYHDDRLLVIDHIRTMGSEGEEGTPCSRVHVIDPETGEKQVRFTLGENADLVAVHGDTLVVSQYNDATAYSLSKGEKIVTYSIETLPDLFPELSSGIANLMWGGRSSIMEMTANNGKQYSLSLQNGVLYSAADAKAEDEFQPSKDLYVTETELKRNDERWGTTLVSLEGQNGNSYELFLTSYQDSVLNPNLSFLDGEFVAVNTDSSFIILSYETLEHEEFVLTCMSRDCRTVLWEIRQAQYNSEYSFSDYIQPQVGFNQQAGTLCFWIDGEVYCVDSRSGKLLWQTKL